MKMVIIDDGINEKRYNIGELWLNLEITRDLQIRQRVDYSPYEPSHGTTCGAIIKKYSPDAALGSIKVLNETGRGVREQLVTALRWCADNAIKLVSMSLGTIDFRDYEAVQKAVEYAAQKGVIIVAACNNKNIYTHPASMDKVIGVKCDTGGILGENEFIYNDFAPDGIEITACGTHSLLTFDRQAKTTPPCNSFATPLVTAKTAQFILENGHIKLKEIRRKLKKESVKGQKKEMLDRLFMQRFKESVEVPVILLCNYKGTQGREIVRGITRLFRKDGYNAVGLYEHTSWLKNGLQIVSHGNRLETNDKISSSDIKVINSVYGPDIIIIGLNALNYTIRDISDMEKDIEIDIKVIISDGSNNEIERLKKNNSESKLILIGDTDNQERFWATFNNYSIKKLTSLYNQILTLYNPLTFGMDGK